jgi:hypothetical protein
MKIVETRLPANRATLHPRGSGQREAVIFFGVNALFRRLDENPDTERYARRVSRLLPGHKFPILEYRARASKKRPPA